MSMVTSGAGVIQWEHHRTWQLDLAAVGSEFCRAEGALVLPGGFSSWSVFFRRSAQTGAGSRFDLLLWTAPIFFQTLDTPITPATAPQLLLPVTTLPTTGLQMLIGAGGPLVFAGKIATDQPMGSLLFWEMRNLLFPGTITGDIYLVPNHTGTVTMPRIARTVDGSGHACGNGGRPTAASYRNG